MWQVQVWGAYPFLERGSVALHTELLHGHSTVRVWRGHMMVRGLAKLDS